MSPFLFSKYEGKRQRANCLVIPVDEPRDYTIFLLMALFGTVGAALLALHFHNQNEIASKVQIAVIAQKCGHGCHYQPIIKSAGNIAELCATSHLQGT